MQIHQDCLAGFSQIFSASDVNVIIQYRLQAAFLHQEGYHLYAQRTWDYEVTAARQLADILKDPALPVMEIPKELRAGDILLSEQQRKAIGLALNSRLAVILGGAGSGDHAH